MFVSLKCFSLILPADAAPINQSFTYDAANRLTAAGTVSYDMDLAGNLREISGSVTPVLSLPPTSSVGAGAQSGLTVSVSANVSWTATSNQSWLTITNGNSGTGNGTITFSVTANGGSARPATIQVSQQGGGLSSTCTVTQAAAVSMFSVTTSSSPSPGGTTSGGGSYASGATAQVVATVNSGYAFVNWTVAGSPVSTSSTYSFTVDRNVQIVANFSPVTALSTAVDAPGRLFFASGDAGWFGQAVTTHDDTDAARSGPIGDFQSSGFETLVDGPSSVSFFWKVSSEVNFDFLRVFIDDTDQGGAISGEVDWVKRSISIPSGSHWVRWTYTKDSSRSSGSDSGYVDEVVVRPNSGYWFDLAVRQAEVRKYESQLRRAKAPGKIKAAKKKLRTARSSLSSLVYY